jgi:hypothetical protein
MPPQGLHCGDSQFHFRVSCSDDDPHVWKETKEWNPTFIEEYHLGNLKNYLERAIPEVASKEAILLLVEAVVTPTAAVTVALGIVVEDALLPVPEEEDALVVALPVEEELLDFVMEYSTSSIEDTTLMPAPASMPNVARL